MAEREDEGAPVLDEPEAHLEGLEQRFLEALERHRAHDVDGALELLKGVLRAEPRLPEPRLELTRIYLDTGRLDEAEEEAREAVRLLEAGGQWTLELPPAALLSLGWNLLGEILRSQADQDEVVFGDPAIWGRLMAESKAAFRRAAQLDPTNEHAAQWAGSLEIEDLKATAEAPST